MSDSTVHHLCETRPAHTVVDDVHDTVDHTVDDIVRRLVACADPRVVFTSLTRLCVPVFSEVCEVVDDDNAPVDVPRWNASARPDLHSVPARDNRSTIRTRFGRAPDDTGPDYCGVVVHRMADRTVDPMVVAGAHRLVERAVGVVTRARLADQLRLAREESAQLHVALAHSREIGPAIGILMMNDKVTYDVAFETLRAASQNRNRKLHDLAVDIMATGELEHRPSRR